MIVMPSNERTAARTHLNGTKVQSETLSRMKLPVRTFHCIDGKYPLLARANRE